MRIDLFLKKCCLVKQRSLVKRACEKGIILVDGKPVKAGKRIAAGQVVMVDFADRYLEIRVLDIPKGNVSRSQAHRFYEVIRDEKKDPASLL